MESPIGKKEKKKRSPALLFLFLIGLSILLYPTVSNMWNTYRDQKLIRHYNETAGTIGEEEEKQLLEAAKEYNEQIALESVPDAFSSRSDVKDETYENLLNPDGNGMMGYVEIPCIDVDIPIYHGTTETSLEKGAGHLPGSSLPIGGEGTHAVLAGHRGLPRAKIFTDLDQMEKGDLFFIHILNQTLAYEVDQIKIVKPDDTKALAVSPGEDYVTLLTCTPYGVNTHRLLVRGKRTEYVPEETEESTLQKLTEADPFILMLIGLSVLLVLILIFYLISKRKDTKEKRMEKMDKEESQDEKKKME